MLARPASASLRAVSHDAAPLAPTGPRESVVSESDPRWRAIVARDASADGRFYYSVLTTRVYCRPSCAARLPRRENVAFHDTTLAAERAGYRACKRCKPGQPSLAEAHVALVAELCRFIASAPESPSLEQLARRAKLSPHHLHRVFKSVTGLTPRAYASEARAERVRRALAAGNSVTRALYGAGFGSAGRFYEQSDRVLGMAPSAYRAGGASERICFGTSPCSLGTVLVASSARGVCAILLGDAPGALVADLKRRFPRAELDAGDAAFQSLVADVLACVEGRGEGLALPLDLRGTAFQSRVWQALREIPSGQSESYGALAARVGSPRSVRAVASACAANALAVVVPCHRVLRGNGALSGYRWGIERKRALLAREAAAARVDVGRVPEISAKSGSRPRRG